MKPKLNAKQTATIAEAVAALHNTEQHNLAAELYELIRTPTPKKDVNHRPTFREAWGEGNTK